MTTTDYRPVSCDLHSEVELLAMRRARIRLDADLDHGTVSELWCTVEDIRTRDGAEFLELRDAQGGAFSCRLDKVTRMILEDGRQISA